jgi:uncharacterized protein (UPF0332 family)
MSIASADLHQLAATLSEMGGETAWRSATSRAYYAAYHSAKLTSDNLPDNDHFVIEGGTHARLIDKYKTYRNFSSTEGKKARAIAYVLLDLKQRREACDYDLKHDVFQDQAKVAVFQALALEEKLRDFEAEVLKDQAA